VRNTVDRRISPPAWPGAICDGRAGDVYGGAAKEPGLACRLQYRCFGNSSGTRLVLIHQHRAGLPVIFRPGSRCLVPVPSGLFHPGHVPGDRAAAEIAHRGGLAMALFPAMSF